MLLERIVNHFSSYLIISDITLYIMSTAVLMMSFIYIINIFIKKDKFERNMLYTGVLIRILMFIGFTIEFAHQMTTYDKYRPIYSAKWDAVVQLVHFLFWGYIAVTAVYYILTIGMNKFKGYTYTVDIAMMSIPIVYGVVLGIFGGSAMNDGAAILVVPLAGLELYLFFQCYWRKDKLWYMALSIAAIINIIVSYKVKPLKIMMPFAAFMFLLVIYEVIFTRINLDKYRRHTIIVPLILIFIANPIYNIFNIYSNNQDYVVSNIFYKGVKNASLDEIEKRIRCVIENSKDKMVVNEVSNSYISKEYNITLGEYKIHTFDVDGKNLQIERTKENIEKSVSFDSKDIINKSVQLIKNIGYTYNEEKYQIMTSDSDGKYIIKLYHKFKNGDIAEESEYPICEIKWDGDGKLNRLFITGAFDIKDYSIVKIDENKIKEKIDNFYKYMNENTPDYVYSSVNNIWRGTINIKCQDGKSFDIDSANGEIVRFDDFSNKDSMKFDKTKEGIAKNREKAKKYIESISPFFNNGSFKDTDLGKQYTYGEYNFIGSVPAGKVFISALVNYKGELINFSQQLKPEARKYSQKSFNLNKDEAIKLVKARYNPLKVYTAKASLIKCTDDFYSSELKWRVCIIPFMSPEKQYYLVDVKTGIVEPVGVYKEGIKGEGM